MYGKTKVGSRIQEARQRRGLSRAELAAEIGVSAKYISELERGAKSLSLDKFALLCEKLSLSADSLLFGADGTDGAVTIMGMINHCDKKKLPYLEQIVRSFLGAYYD